MAFPVLVQLPDDAVFHALQEGQQAGVVHGWGGLEMQLLGLLLLRVCLYTDLIAATGLSDDVGGGDGPRLGAFLWKRRSAQLVGIEGLSPRNVPAILHSDAVSLEWPIYVPKA